MKKLIIIPILLISIISSGTKYYVKSTGNDSNSGLSDGQAWAHHPWMSTWTGNVTLSPGDSICMRRGDSWIMATPSSAYITISQSGIAGYPITTTWYGATGNKPIIQITGNYPYPVIQDLGKSFITIDHLDLSHFSYTRIVDGPSGIEFGKDYNYNVPHDWIITNCDIHNIPNIGIHGYDDSYNVIIGDTSATSCATSLDYSNNIYDCGYAGIILSGRDPITEVSHWEVYHNYVHNIDYSTGIIEDAYGIVFSSSGLVGSGRGYSDGWPNYCVAKYNRIENVPGHEGIDNHGGSYHYYQDNYIFNCRVGIAASAADRENSPAPYLNNCYIERNTIENPGENLLGPNCFIYLVGENDLYKPTNCYIKNNVIFYTSRPSGENDNIGIQIYSVDGITIEGNKIYNGPFASNGDADAGLRIGRPNNNVKNITISKNWICNWDLGVYTQTSAVEGDMTYFDNIITSFGRAFLAYGGTFLGNFTLFNNTILSSSSANYPYAIDFSGSEISSGSSLVIKNNISGFTSVASNGYYILTPDTINGSLIIDNNLYYNSTKTKPFDLQGMDFLFSDWKGHSYDINSLDNTNPLFQNFSGSYSQDVDFELQKSSPAIDAGTDVGLTTDYAGNPISGPPDIGAYEYQSQQSASVPVYVSSSVENATPTILNIIYSLNLANFVPAASAFTVTVNSAARTVSAVAVSGTTVYLTLASPVAYGDVVTVAYTKPSSNPLQTAAGTQAASFSYQNVTNNVAAPNPVYVSSQIQNATPSKLDMTYSLALGNTIPATTAFSVTVNSAARQVSAVAVSGTTVSLTLASPVAYGDVVTVAYTKPSSNPLQTAAGAQAASFSFRM